MDSLLEIGQIGLLRDIPAEMNILKNENLILKNRYANQKSELRFLYIIIAGIVIYFIWKDFKKVTNKKTEDEYINS